MKMIIKKCCAAVLLLFALTFGFAGCQHDEGMFEEGAEETEEAFEEAGDEIEDAVD